MSSYIPFNLVDADSRDIIESSQPVAIVDKEDHAMVRFCDTVVTWIAEDFTHMVDSDTLDKEGEQIFNKLTEEANRIAHLYRQDKQTGEADAEECYPGLCQQSFDFAMFVHGHLAKRGSTPQAKEAATDTMRTRSRQLAEALKNHYGNLQKGKAKARVATGTAPQPSGSGSEPS